MSIELEVRRYQGGDRHFHDYNQILFPLQGSMRIDVEGRRGIVASHCVAVIPERCEHDFEPSRDCSMLVLDVETGALSDELRPDVLSKNAPVVTRVEPFLWRLFSLLGAEVEADVRRARDAARLALTALQLIRPVEGSSPRRSDRRILAAARLLTEEDEAPGVDDVARSIGLRQSQFHALFRVTTGQSPKQYRLRRLIDRAVDRLVTTSDPISEIAYEFGYQNVSSFNRLFKQRFGVTPSQFRMSAKRD